MDWSNILNNHNSFQELTEAYQQLETDCASGNESAIATDIQNLYRHPPASSGYYQQQMIGQLKQVVITLAGTIQLHADLLVNKWQDFSGAWHTDTLGGTIMDPNGKPLTLAEALQNPSLAGCTVSLPEFDYGIFSGTVNGELDTINGDKVISMDPGRHDDEIEPPLDAASGGALGWWDNNNHHGEYQFECSGTLSAIEQNGQTSYFDSSGGAGNSAAISQLQAILNGVGH